MRPSQAMFCAVCSGSIKATREFGRTTARRSDGRSISRTRQVPYAFRTRGCKCRAQPQRHEVGRSCANQLSQKKLRSRGVQTENLSKILSSQVSCVYFRDDGPCDDRPIETFLWTSSAGDCPDRRAAATVVFLPHMGKHVYAPPTFAGGPQKMT